ncbi:hypothetical protein Q3G72_015438 [Acer saccharum]|nr:hypothetical protein Q3G72_015438 [Acer saccharum]
MHMDESFHYKTPVVMPRQGICRQRDSAADLVPHSYLEDAAALPRVQHEVPPPQQDTIAAASAVNAQTKQVRIPSRRPADGLSRSLIAAVGEDDSSTVENSIVGTPQLAKTALQPRQQFGSLTRAAALLEDLYGLSAVVGQDDSATAAHFVDYCCLSDAVGENITPTADTTGASAVGAQSQQDTAGTSAIGAQSQQDSVAASDVGPHTQHDTVVAASVIPADPSLHVDRPVQLKNALLKCETLKFAGEDEDDASRRAPETSAGDKRRRRKVREFGCLGEKNWVKS